jgi:4-diphosphocytidyl-2-C-methyl-D-erythritol kinase
MHSYTLIAPAKINLYLEIIGDRSDGFHELVMILQSIELADKIHIKPSNTENILLHCNHPQVPTDQSNLAYRAAKLICDTFPEVYANYGGVELTIEKNIPVAAGLAGGSTNAAAVLVGLNLMWQLGLTQPELQDLAAQLGSDIPFCLCGGTAIATGRGEKLDSIKNINNLWVVLAKYNNLSVSTPWAYNSYREQFNHLYISDSQGINQRTRQVHSGDLVKAISNKNSEVIGALLYNDLEKVVLPEFPTVKALIDAFKAENVLGSMMSGSGPTVFALCDNQNQAEAIANKVQKTINDSNLHCWVAQMCTHGIIKQ